MIPGGDGPGQPDDAVSGGLSRSKRSIVKIELDEKSFLRRRPEVEHEREVALFDLLEENVFTLKADPAASPKFDLNGPFHLRLGVAEDRLIFDVRDTSGAPRREIVLALRPFRMVIKDYFLVCESYFDAIKSLSPTQIESIDMGRRGLHNEGAQMLKERLAAHVELNQGTARRFFTLLCILHMRG
jgi:uncharacterized protein (UPF0262 family)